MRLNRLDLIRYGQFNEAQIVLPIHTDGTPDVTVIYGPNEAGKSTAFAGFLELLFGMKSRDHPYAFRFDRKDLLIGAELDLPGHGPTVLRRNGKKTQSLLDEQGRPVEEAILSSALHGIGGDAYVERFSLNDQGLRDGGARIAEAQGDLGQLLHAGVSGLTSMAATLDQMDTRADQFHKKGGRATTLKTGKDRLTEIGRELRAERLTPERDRKLCQDRDAAQAAFDAADTALNRARKRQVAGQAAQVWYDRTEDINRADEALKGYPDGPDLPKGAGERIAGFVATIAQTTGRIAEADEKIAGYDDVISDNKTDPVAEELAAELARLDQLMIDGAPLTARATTAWSDLEKRTNDRDDLVHQMDQVLAALSVPHVPAASLALAPDVLEELALAAQACLTAKTAEKTALGTAASARDQQGDAPPQPQDLSQLKVTWEALRDVADMSVHENSLTTETARLAKAASGLPGTWQGLIHAGLPARETLEEVERDWNTLTAKLATSGTDLAAREAEYNAAQSERQVDEATPSAVDAVTTEETRRLRDVSWAAHRDMLSAETGETFAAAMYADDGARANFLTGAEARQRLESSRRQESDAQAKRDTAKARHDTLTGQRDALVTRAAALSTDLGLPLDTLPAAFVSRHAALLNAAGIAADAASAEKELTARVDRRQSAFDDLSVAAQLIGIEGTESDLLARVNAALTLQDSVRHTWEKWTQNGTVVTSLEETAAQAKSDRDTADNALAALTAALPLVDRSAAGVNAALPHMRTLQRQHSDHGKIVGRIEALEGAVTALTESAMRMVAILDDPSDTEFDPHTLIESARVRVSKADRAAALRVDEERRRAEEMQSRAGANTARDEAQNQLDSCFEGQGGRDFLPPDRSALLTERDAQRATRREADRHRTEARTGVEDTLFDEELACLPDAAREAEVQQVLDDAQEARDQARDARGEAERLYREAYDAAERSDLSTERATILEELRSDARRAVVARLGVLAARSALKRLASERRTTMLRDVEEAFVAMTSPAWTKVEVWSQSEGEKLVGVQPDGNIVPVEMMSTGTMGQLYFALRLAGYRGFARDPGPLPMVLDDIMETFDDTRAAAALNLCAGIGRSGQAIIFTHHAHLVDLARANIPGVSIVEMPG